MKIKKLVLLLAACVAFSGTLAACKAEEPPAPQVPKEEAIEPIVPKNSGRESTLRIALQGEDEEKRKVLEEIAQKYEADFPNAKIEFFPLSGVEELREKLAAGEQLDLCELKDGEELSLALEGSLFDFYPYLLGWGERSGLNEGAKFAAASMGPESAYLIPNDYSMDLLYYRTDWFGEYAETKIRVPRVWSEVPTAAEQLAENGEGLLLGGKEKLLDYYNSQVWGSVATGRMAAVGAGEFSAANEGGSVYSLTQVRKNTVSGVTAEETVDLAKKGMEEFLSVFGSSVPREALSWTEGQAVEAFGEGKGAMLLADQSYLPALREKLGDALGVTTYPRGLAGFAVMAERYRGWSVLRSSSDTETAVHFLLYLSNLDNNTHYAMELDTMPIHIMAADLEESLLAEEGDRYQPLMAMKRNDWFVFASEPRMYEAYEGYPEKAHELLLSWLSGEKTLEDTAAWFTEYWETAYQAEGKKWK